MAITQFHSQLDYGRTEQGKQSCLCMDDFGVKYFSTDDADHLLKSLKNHYAVLTDWGGGG